MGLQGPSEDRAPSSLGVWHGLADRNGGGEMSEGR